MRINQFEMIAALENCSSLSEAADKLYMTQPSISKAVRELEDEVGYEILKRKKDGVVFTNNGKEVLRLCKDILADIEHMKSLRRDVDEDVVGQISLAGNGYLSGTIFTQVVMSLKEFYPNLTIRFHEAFSTDIIEKVRMETVDVGVIMMYSIDRADMLKRIERYGLTYEPCFVDRVGFYARRQHVLHHKNEVLMADVLAYPYVTGGNHEVAQKMNQLFRAYRSEQNVEIISNVRQRFMYLASQNAITSMPEKLYDLDGEAKKYLKQIFVQDMNWTAEVGMIYKDERRSALQDLVVEELRDKMALDEA